MVAVERTSEYSKLPSEAQLVANWPQSGSIKVNNLTIRYRKSLPMSLKNVSFEVQSGQRIGVGMWSVACV